MHGRNMLVDAGRAADGDTLPLDQVSEHVRNMLVPVQELQSVRNSLAAVRVLHVLREEKHQAAKEVPKAGLEELHSTMMQAATARVVPHMPVSVHQVLQRQLHSS